MRLKAHLSYLGWGALFGFLISRSGATSFRMINGMFLFTDLRLYGVIGGAIAVALPGMALMKARRRGPGGRRINLPSHRLTPGTLPGAALFGLGWALTGTCPGPAVVQVGEGHFAALATVAGIFLGNLLYARAHKKWFHWVPDTCS